MGRYALSEWKKEKDEIVELVYIIFCSYSFRHTASITLRAFEFRLGAFMTNVPRRFHSTELTHA